MKRLLLLGGGHAHVRVLSDLAKRAIPGWEVHLVSPYPRQIYSGMLPGWIAGHYEIEDCAVRLDSLCDLARVARTQTWATRIDTPNKTVICEDGRALRFDVLSIDTGPVSYLSAVRGAAEYATPIRPIETFIEGWPRLVDRILSRCRRFDLVVLGAGAAGVELALAIQRRALRDGWSHLRVHLIGAEALPMSGSSEWTRRRVLREIRRAGVTWVGGGRVTKIDHKELSFEDGTRQGFDECLVVTGAASPSWTRDSQLETDPGGFIRVSSTLQSVSHPNVFAAGDIASYASARPKSGVFAVRAGPVLSANIRAYCLGSELRKWTPQTKALYLVSTGDRRAIASWGGITLAGRWVWRWKDWIDRRFMAQFAASSQR